MLDRVDDRNHRHQISNKEKTLKNWNIQEIYKFFLVWNLVSMISIIIDNDDNYETFSLSTWTSNCYDIFYVEVSYVCTNLLVIRKSDIFVKEDVRGGRNIFLKSYVWEYEKFSIHEIFETRCITRTHLESTSE